jgi:hypothetical protein
MRSTKTKPAEGLRMKSSIELLADLNTAEKTWGCALLTVGFPRMTRAVLSSFPERLQILEGLLQQGGIPVGMIGIEDFRIHRW